MAVLQPQNQGLLSYGATKDTIDLQSLDGDIEADMYFLRRHRHYVTEKPYSMRYPVDGIPQTNIARDKYSITLHDIRKLSEEPDLDSYGFAVMPLQSRMRYQDFSDPDKIETVYYLDIAEALKKTLGARHVFVMDNAVRRRHPAFPISTGKDYVHDQPTSMAHIDFTREEGEKMLNTLYGDRACEVLRGRWQIVNVWKPLKGPVRDWPLAIADARSVDMANDTMPGDIAFPTWYTENIQVMYNAAYRWYHLSDQMPDEALIFKSSDSSPEVPFACPHAGFLNKAVGATSTPRESIDCRCFVLYADIAEFPREVGTLYSEDHSQSAHM